MATGLCLPASAQERDLLGRGLAFAPSGPAIQRTWQGYTDLKFERIDENLSASVQYDERYRPLSIEIIPGSVKVSANDSFPAYDVYASYSPDLVAGIESYETNIVLYRKTEGGLRLFTLEGDGLRIGPDEAAAAELPGYASLASALNFSKPGKAGKRVHVATALALPEAEANRLVSRLLPADAPEAGPVAGLAPEGRLRFAAEGAPIIKVWNEYLPKPILDPVDDLLAASVETDSRYRPYAIDVLPGRLQGAAGLERFPAYRVYARYDAALVSGIENYESFVKLCYKEPRAGRLYFLRDGYLAGGLGLEPQPGRDGYLALTPPIDFSKKGAPGTRSWVCTFLVLTQDEADEVGRCLRPDNLEVEASAVDDSPFDTSGEEQFAPSSYENGRGSLPRLSPVANADGTCSLAWVGTRGLHVCQVGADLRLVKDRVVGPELETYGGFTKDTDGNCYILTGKKNADGDFSSDLRLTKYDSSLRRLSSCEIPTSKAGFDVMEPFEASESRLVYAQGRVYVHMGKIMHRGDDGLNHQSSILVAVDSKSMRLDMDASMKQVAAHSFMQRLVLQDGEPILLDLADNYPRGIQITKPGSGSRVVFTYKTRMADADLNPAGKRLGAGLWSNDNNTYSELGGLAATDKGIVALASSEGSFDNASAKGYLNGSRNLFMLLVAPDFWDKPVTLLDGKPEAEVVSDQVVLSRGPESALFSFYDFNGGLHYQRNRGIAWLTDFSDPRQDNASRPKLVALGDGRLVALWEQWRDSSYKDTRYLIFDSGGTVLQGAKSLGDERLPRGDDPILLGGRIVWFTGDSTSRRILAHALKP
jgi:hypothetical protein